ncbi:hypothetical protein D0U04_30245, partial [Bacillus clarus]
MKKRVHYPEKIKWKVIKMKKEGYSNRTIMDAFNREIISCVSSESQTLTLAMKTLKKVIRGRTAKGVIF